MGGWLVLLFGLGVSVRGVGGNGREGMLDKRVRRPSFPGWLAQSYELLI